ncbi:MAG TPA: transcriptional repressor [Candidatus Paceibacterota bacterium]
MQISVKSSGPFADALRQAGFRATYGRVALLEVLTKSHTPISVEAAARLVRGKLDLVNAYRALEAFTRAGLARRVDVGHRHIHYGLASLGRHQHAFVCVCGLAKTL